MSNLAKSLMAFVGLLAMLLVASRQLFLSVVMRDATGLSIAGGESHLWLAAIACVFACMAGGLMFYFFSRHENYKSKVEMTPTGPLFTPIINRAILAAPAPFDAHRWALANSWLVKQPDDRTPMDGSVSVSGQTPSGQRSFARRTHQLMFKKWSQDRHDS